MERCSKRRTEMKARLADLPQSKRITAAYSAPRVRSWVFRWCQVPRRGDGAVWGALRIISGEIKVPPLGIGWDTFGAALVRGVSNRRHEYNLQGQLLTSNDSVGSRSRARMEKPPPVGRGLMFSRPAKGRQAALRRAVNAD